MLKISPLFSPPSPWPPPISSWPPHTSALPSSLLSSLLSISLRNSRIWLSSLFLFLAGVQSGTGTGSDTLEVSGVEATTASGPDDEISTGGVMDGLLPNAASITPHHFQEAAVASPPSVLMPVLGHFKSCKKVHISKA